MDSRVDMNEVRKCLKEAGILDEDLPDDKMIEFYDAIKSSETSVESAEKSLNESANELLEAIQNSESIAPSTSKRDKRCILVDEDLSVDKEPILDATKAIFGFNDMPPMQPCPLKVLYHPPKYVNILSSEKYLKADSETRINMWYEYHVQLNKLQYDMGRLSQTVASTCRPIIVGEQDDASESSDMLNKQESHPDLYVSRSGRHCKRKMYKESEDSDMELNSCIIKRSKDDDFAVKIQESNNNLSDDEFDKMKKSKHLNHQKDVDFAVKMESNNNLSDDEFDKLKKPKTQPKTYSAKKPSNEEIMMRSSLFKDTNHNSKATGRTSKIMNAVKDQIEEVKKQEERSEIFNKSLNVDSDDGDDLLESVTERRVIPPPLPKNAKRGRRKVNPLNITTSPKSSEIIQNGASVSGVVANGYDNQSSSPRSTRRLGNDNKGNTASGPPRAKKEVNTVLCPLCSKSFPRKEIEDHASTCGVDPFPLPPRKYQRITCEVCDKVVLFDTDYELHVRSCIGKKKMS